MNEIILTHTGMLGDFFFCLPVASWLHRTQDVKTHWVLVDGFEPFHHIESLLMQQPFTSRLSLVPHHFRWGCGGQPYKFNPAYYGINGSYFNLGFRSFPDKYIPEFYAEEHELSYDKDYRIDPGPNIVGSGEILRSREILMKVLAPQATPIPWKFALLDLIRMLSAAEEVHAWFGGMSIMCHMIKRKFTCYYAKVNGDLNVRSRYIPDDDLVVWRDAQDLFDWGSPLLQLTVTIDGGIHS